MSTLVSISNKGSEGGPNIRVKILQVGDRELHANGEHNIAPGATKDVLVDSEQALQIEEVAA